MEFKKKKWCHDPQPFAYKDTAPNSAGTIESKKILLLFISTGSSTFFNHKIAIAIFIYMK